MTTPIFECKWCKKGVCRAHPDEANCDYKTLSFDKDSIIKRIDEELDIVEKMIIGFKDLNKVDKQSQMAKVADKIIGMKIMIETLQSEFKFQYKSKRGPLAFLKLVTMAKKYGGK